MQVETATLEEIFDEMIRLRLKYRVTSLETYSKHQTVWVEIKGKTDGVEISSEETIDLIPGVSISDVVRRCFAKWHRTAARGSALLLSPPLEAVKLESPKSQSSDDLPF